MASKKVKGFKAFNKDLTCKDFQYEIGKEYEYKGEVKICSSGFHFCKSLADCYNFYGMNEDTRICEVVAWGTVLTDEDGIKYVTDHIKILKEVKNPREKSNLSKSSSGYCNSGDWNSGDCNSGDWNSGDCNSGNRNSGYCNSGNRNSGDWNSGDWNSGDWNSGDWNSGNSNSGNRNSGDWNSGDWNSGDWNSGNSNSGNRNSGDWNSGDWNSGDWNSGDWNSGDWNSGVFNTDKTPKIKMFDKESDWTMDTWRSSDAYWILRDCPYSHSNFIYASDMTDEEKENHPEHKTIGGYIKVFKVTTKDKQEWWDGLSEDNKNTIKALPNFDAGKFCECIGINHI